VGAYPSSYATPAQLLVRVAVAAVADGLEVGDVVSVWAERSEPVEVVDERGRAAVAALADGVR
jgi:hypothetical protein